MVIVNCLTTFSLSSGPPLLPFSFLRFRLSNKEQSHLNEGSDTGTGRSAGTRNGHAMEELKKKKDDSDTQTFPIGTKVSKQFDEGLFRGEIRSYDTTNRLYFIRYSDGDTEDMDEAEVRDCIDGRIGDSANNVTTADDGDEEETTTAGTLCFVLSYPHQY